MVFIVVASLYVGGAVAIFYFTSLVGFDAETGKRGIDLATRIEVALLWPFAPLLPVVRDGMDDDPPRAA